MAQKGAHHVSLATDINSTQAQLDKATYLHFKEEIEASGPSAVYKAVANGTVNGVTQDDARGHTVQFAGDALRDSLMRVEQREFSYQPLPEGRLEVLRDMYDEFSVLDASERPLGVPHGVSFVTITIDPLKYIHYLFTLFESLGGVAYRAELTAFSDLGTLDPASLERVGSATAPAPTSSFGPILVNCSGLGAKTLAGDASLSPIRGQTVLIHAPWVKWGATLKGFKNIDENYVDPVNGNVVDVASAMNRTRRRSSDQEWIYSYYIPRPDGYVLLGGTRDNSADDSTDPETTIRIKQRALKLCPSLVHPNKRSARNTIFDLDCATDAERCALRPGRNAIRLEPETIGDFFIVHNYGHDGQGFQSSWGCAQRVVELIKSQAKL